MDQQILILNKNSQSTVHKAWYFGKKKAFQGVTIMTTNIQWHLGALFLFIFTTITHATSCTFDMSGVVSTSHELGVIDVEYIQSESLQIAAVDENNQRLGYSSDLLYQIRNEQGSGFFRSNQILYGQSTLFNRVIWAFDQYPKSIGKYHLISYQMKRTPIFKRSFVTIGDSLTWMYEGRYLRCLLRDQGLEYDFLGTHTDSFGFAHEGAGGETSKNVLDRIDSIPPADAYFLLIGTNDWAYSPQSTVDNIKQIANKLQDKKKDVVIYVSTLLPAEDYTGHQEHNDAVNAILRKNKFVCGKCKLIDVGASFQALPDGWQTKLIDGLHPNYKGYVALAKIIASYVNPTHEEEV